MKLCATASEIATSERTDRSSERSHHIITKYHCPAWISIRESMRRQGSSYFWIATAEKGGGKGGLTFLRI